ncbi:hypothetical protein [Planomonospora parontospora]|uniref:hypothetical protein n=1 Tax=Planomonospora parontospora TaxID=58119 RepID=UPI0016704BBF|nr:hypothetical protein [Planomonospora parontospora]GGL51586.1 hypothetical protein GCM10014719_61130 [Planomonospora parontospora subsp. antibiotica]GII19615.1 hypothetical protein Ppa05_63410 [Planomonospora parontospora subsp. antibiotica]
MSDQAPGIPGIDELRKRLYGTFVSAVRVATPGQVAEARRAVEAVRAEDPTLVERMEQFWRSGEDPARVSA